VCDYSTTVVPVVVFFKLDALNNGLFDAQQGTP